MKAVPAWGIACIILVLAVLTGVREAAATVYSIRVDRAARQKFGLSYPVTYKFTIPAGTTGLTAEYRYSDAGQWIRLPERKAGDLFNGIDAVRFDRSGGSAYASVRFGPDSDTIYLRVNDGSGRELDISFDSIPRYYDDRRAAVTITLDDYGTWSDSSFNTAAGMLAARGLHFSAGVITRQVTDWNLLQDLVNRHGEYLEISSHSDNHYCYADSYKEGSYENETTWSRDVLRNNLSFGGSPHIPLFIEPCGYSDANLAAAVTGAGFLVTRSVQAGYPAGAGFAPWDDQQGRYGRAPVVFNDYERANDAKLLNEANGLFDNTLAGGGIYHLLNHPALGLWQAGSHFVRHLDYIRGRSDLWYVSFGQLYQYRFLQEMRGNLSIQPIIPGTPAAGFSALPLTGRAPLNVTFTDSSSGQITGWQWDFGDGHGSTERNPAHTYTASGTYTATLVVANGTQYSSPESVVIAADLPYKISTGAIGNGNIACTPGTDVDYMTPVSCTASAGAGSRIVDVAVDGAAQPVTNPGSFTWDFAAMTEDHSISATFAPITYTINFVSGGNGAITGPVPQTIEHGGSTAAVTAVPATGHRFAGWSDTSGFTSTDNPLVLTGITASRTITAGFSQETYTIEFVAGANGSLAGSAVQTVGYGGSATAVTAIPAAGYRFVNWTGPDGFTSTANPLEIAGVTSSMTVTAHFGVAPHTVTPQSGASGSISPAAPQQVEHTGTLTFTVVPAAGYRITEVSGCGGTLAGTAYTTGPVTEDCSVTATFAQIAYPVTGSVGGGVGSVTCSSPVPHGMSLSCTVVPEAGYQLASVTDNGRDVTASVTAGSYESAPVVGEHAIVVTFAPIPYTLVDAVRVQQQVLGKVILSDKEKARLDVAPLGEDGMPEPDGILDVADVVIMLRKLVGAIDW